MATMAEQFRDDFAERMHKGLNKSLRELGEEDSSVHGAASVAVLADAVANSYDIDLRYCGCDPRDCVCWDCEVDSAVKKWLFGTIPEKYICSGPHLFAARFADGSSVCVTEAYPDADFENDPYIVYEHLRTQRRVLAYTSQPDAAAN